MKYQLWQGTRYVGGCKGKAEALHWARGLADRTNAPVTLRSGPRTHEVTPRGARTAQTRAARRP